jgi:hypothetical protein
MAPCALASAAAMTSILSEHCGGAKVAPAGTEDIPPPGLSAVSWAVAALSGSVIN